MVLGALALGALACRSKSNPASGGPAGSASAAVVAAHCRKPAGDTVVLLGSDAKPSAPPQTDEDEEEEAPEHPFSVELGDARASERTFAVPGIENRGGANFAVAAFVDVASGEGRVVEIGRVFGDVDAPVVAAHGDRWLLAVPNSDAGGVTLRLVLVSPPFGPGDVRRGPEVTSVRRDASGAALLVREERGLLVWNTLEKGQARLAAVGIDPNGPKLVGEPSLLAASALADAEGPRLALRPSGYYLAYLAHAEVKERRPLRGDDSDAGSPENLVEGTMSFIEVVPLDVHGKAAGSALRVTPNATNVLSFDVAPLGDGSLLVFYREAQGGPGLDRPTVQVVRVRPDGTLDKSSWDVGESSGLPTLLVDAAPPAPDRWALLALLGDKRTALATIAPDTLALGELREDPEIGASEPLAVRGGRFLSALSRGTRRELSLFECGNALPTVRR